MSSSQPPRENSDTEPPVDRRFRLVDRRWWTRRRPSSHRADRAVSPVVGVAAMLAVTVVLAAVVGGVALSTAADGTVAGTDRPERVVVDVRADAATGRVTLVHRGGDAVDVRRLRVRILVDGRPLRHQPPVPFFAASGFHGGPTGPFNAAADSRWTAGETASLRIAGTNHPSLTAGTTVTVRLYADDRRLGGGKTVAAG